MLAITGQTKVEEEDRQRALHLLAGTPLLHDEAFFEKTARALAASRAIEREECAKAAEKVQPILMGTGGTHVECRTWEQPNPVAQACAHAIRCRTVWEPVGSPSEGDEP